MNKQNDQPKPSPQDPVFSWGDLARGLGMYLLAWAVIVMAMFFQAIPERLKPIVDLINGSIYPRLAMLVVSLGLTSAVFAAGRLVDITSVRFLNVGLDKILSNPKLRAYFRALPLGFHFAVVGVVVLLSFFLLPYCQAPGAVKFSINDVSYFTGDTVTISSGQSITIIAAPVEEGKTITCEWQQAGNAFDSINVSRGCNVTLSTASHPGQGVLTLVASQQFCSQKAFFPLIIQVEDNGQ